MLVAGPTQTTLYHQPEAQHLPTVRRGVARSRLPHLSQIETGTRKQQEHREPLCGEQVKLLRERQLLTAGIFRLLFTHHMNQLDAT